MQQVDGQRVTAHPLERRQVGAAEGLRYPPALEPATEAGAGQEEEDPRQQWVIVCRGEDARVQPQREEKTAVVEGIRQGDGKGTKAQHPLADAGGEEVERRRKEDAGPHRQPLHQRGQQRIEHHRHPEKVQDPEEDQLGGHHQGSDGGDQHPAQKGPGAPAQVVVGEAAHGTGDEDEAEGNVPLEQCHRRRPEPSAAGEVEHIHHIVGGVVKDHQHHRQPPQLIEEGDPALAHRVSSRRSAVRIRPTYIR